MNHTHLALVVFFNHAFALNNSPGAVDEYGRYMAVVGILLSRSANGVRER